MCELAAIAIGLTGIRSAEYLIKTFWQQIKEFFWKENVASITCSSNHPVFHIIAPIVSKFSILLKHSINDFIEKDNIGLSYWYPSNDGEIQLSTESWGKINIRCVLLGKHINYFEISTLKEHTDKLKLFYLNALSHTPLYLDKIRWDQEKERLDRNNMWKKESWFTEYGIFKGNFVIALPSAPPPLSSSSSSRPLIVRRQKAKYIMY